MDFEGFGFGWLCTDLNDLHGFKWILMDFSFILMDFDGFQWNRVEFNGFHGFKWIFADFADQDSPNDFVWVWCAMRSACLWSPVAPSSRCLSISIDFH